MIRDIKTIIADLRQRTQYGSKKFYKPLESPEERDLLYNWYCDNLTIPIIGDNRIISNKENTHISAGYTRIVIGDYGPYIEMSKDMINLCNIELKWPGEPKRPVKYIWMQTKDKLKTKVYYQRERVRYADYLVGYYYMSPEDLNAG